MAANLRFNVSNQKFQAVSYFKSSVFTEKNTIFKKLQTLTSLEISQMDTQLQRYSPSIILWTSKCIHLIVELVSERKRTIGICWNESL